MNTGMPTTADLILVMPELIWCGFGMFIMLLQPVLKNRHFFTFLALVGAIGGTAFSVVSAWNYGPGFSGLILSDAFSLFFHLLLGTVAFLVILASESYLERENLDSPEFLALLLFATAGMGVLASAQELLTAFIGLEMSSISSYVLAGYRRESSKSSESALKYFLLGSFATAFFLYGIALVYGATHTTMIAAMRNVDPHSGYLKLGLALILIGLGFKVAAAPFQIWTPDVYEGAPTPVTALFSAGPKAAAFALLLRIFVSVPAATHYWFWAFWVIAALTMFLGNLGALQPWVAASLSLFLLSLLGLPVTAGFFGKFYIFTVAVHSNLIWLAVLMAVNSVIGSYYYLRLIIVMYMHEPKPDAAIAPVRFPLTARIVLCVTVAGTLYFGLAPTRTIEFLNQPKLIGSIK